jgi:putative polyketide hydroxylase
MSSSQDVQVLIVGGGPVGLTASLLLSRFGVRSLVIERHETTSTHPRARGLSVRTMEIFRELGLEPEVRDRGRALASNEYILAVESLAGAERKRISVRDDAERALLERISPTTFAHCAQDELEPILIAAARRTGMTEIQFGHELVAIEQDDGGTSARIRGPGGERTVRAGYIIGADGSRSTVRRLTGIASHGPGTITENVSIYFRADLRSLTSERPFILCTIRNDKIAGLLLAVNNHDRWVLHVAVDGASPPPDDAHSRELVRHAIGCADIDVDILGVQRWTAAAEVAERFQRGRVFLAGDAAHVMPPAGAFGMNTGLHDVHNLAWKLAAVLAGTAAPRLLASYEAERAPVAWFTTEQAARRMGSMDLAGHLRDAGELADRFRAGARWGAGHAHNVVIAMGYRYSSTAIASDPSLPAATPLDSAEPRFDGTPGTRAPHLWISRDAARRSTLDCLGRRFTLFCADASWIDAARRLPVDVVAIEAGDRANWAEACGVSDTGALLVRPDGFVAWRERATVSSDAAVSILDARLQELSGFVEPRAG